MLCVECGVKQALLFGDTCGSKECVRAYLSKGRGSIHCPEYKSYMRDCLKAVIKQESEGKE